LSGIIGDTGAMATAALVQTVTKPLPEHVGLSRFALGYFRLLHGEEAAA
jgi:hypothetical protein